MVSVNGRGHAPDEVLVLPARADTRDLKHEDAVVLEHIVHLREELRVPADSDMLSNECRSSATSSKQNATQRVTHLSHLERHDLVVLGAFGNVAVIGAQDARLGGGDLHCSNKQKKCVS